MVMNLTRTIVAIVVVLSFVAQPHSTRPAAAHVRDDVVEQPLHQPTQLAVDPARFVGLQSLSDAAVASSQRQQDPLSNRNANPQPLIYTISDDAGDADSSAAGSSAADGTAGVTTEETLTAHHCSFCKLPHVYGAQVSIPETPHCQHRFWVISSRNLTWNPCHADLDSPELKVTRLSCNGVPHASSMDEYLQAIRPDRRVVFYVHGNRTTVVNAIENEFQFFKRVKPYLDNQPTDWVSFSWPSAKKGILLKDAREKAARTDAQGLYLAWLLRHHVERSVPISMVGYSFGARVVSGSLHALGGGSLGRRTLSPPYYVGSDISAGMVAAAFDANWMTPNNYHRYATQNLRTLTVLYNHRDVALRNHWRLTRERSSEALGFSGPRFFGRRFDGTQLPIRALNCTRSVRTRHGERFYYERACSAGQQMACLINQSISAENLHIKTPASAIICDSPAVASTDNKTPGTTSFVQ